ncbi:MAG: penicillin acylase [Planctomycetota bacterium]|jgi:penicillin amidase
MRRRNSRRSLLASLPICLGLGASITHGAPVDPEPEPVTVSAVTRPVRVDLDDRAIPTIAADSPADAFAALGWLHARERFFQMDGMRRQAAGETAALAGPMLLEMDRPNAIARRRELAQRVVEALDPGERAVLEAYTRGVNAGLAGLDGPPMEYRLLNATPTAWRPEDSILVLLTMFDMLQRTADEEAGVAALRQAVPPAIAEWLLAVPGRWDTLLVSAAADTDEAVPSLPDPLPPQAAISPPLDATRLAAAIEIPDDLRPGSNNFAVAGSRTPDGRAIVANDPHLASIAPGLWYRVRLAWPGVNAVGVSLPGAPGLPIGATDHLAWGLTNTTGDFEDLVLIDVDPDDPSRYRGPDGWESFDDREVSIDVAGARPVAVRSRFTRWGPVIDETPDGRPIALLQVSAQPGAIDLGLLGLLEAQDVERGLDVAAAWGGPSQNVVVADATGRIGWTVSGWLPDRRGYDGRSPGTHLDGRGWFGPLEETRRPRVVDPENGTLQTANNRLVPLADADLLGRTWADGGRAWRIRERLAALDVITEVDLHDIQLDEYVQRFEPYRALLLAALKDVPDAEDVRTIVDDWDGSASEETVALPIVAAFRQQLLRRANAMLLARFATRPLDERTARLAASAIHEEPVLQACEARDPRLEVTGGLDWNDVFRAATAAAIAEHRRDPDTPWAERNRLAARHPLGRAHPLVGDRFDLPAVPQAGHWGAVRVLAPSFGASARFIASPGHLEDGSLETPGGQSGDPKSPHYADAHDEWATGLMPRLLPDEPVRILRLEPVAP